MIPSEQTWRLYGYHRNLPHCGITTVTNNLMPVPDCTRTNPTYILSDGSKTSRFERAAFIAFGIFIQKRPSAKKDYTGQEITKSKNRFGTMSHQEKGKPVRNMIAVLPDAEKSFTHDEFQAQLNRYNKIGADKLRSNPIYFLREITTLPDESGLKLAIRPYYQTYPLSGLPRIVSTETELYKHTLNHENNN